MAWKPLLHAFFHSIASLGYIPFALSSVLLSSSSPFVSIHPIAIILIAFTPPLLIFPLLCFSYRFLERFECISLTVQRARTYVMVAGSGLCLLMGMHLVMIYGVGNGHNTAYNRMVYGAPPTRAVAGGGPSAAEFKRMAQLIPLSSSSSSSSSLSLPSGVVLNSQLVEPSQVLPQEQGQEQGQEQDHTAAASTTNKAEVPLTISTLEDVDSTLTQAQAGGGVGEEIQLPLSIISSFFMSLPDSDQGSNTEGATSSSSSLIMDPVEAMLTNMERVAAATGVTEESAAAVEEMMRDANSVASSMRGMGAAAEVGMRKRAVPLAFAPGGEGVVVKSPVPIHLYPSASTSELEVSKDLIDSIEQQQPQLPQLQDKRDSDVGGQTALKVDGQEEDTPLSPQTDPEAHLPSPLPFAIPQLDPFSILLMGAPEQQQHQGGEVQQEQQQLPGPHLYWSKPSPYYPPAGSNNPSSSSVLFDHQDPNRTLGYNLITVHWLLYLTAQSILIFLLVTLFLGVLILTEFVLDREDEDLVHIQYLYWSRVVGIAFATIVSAVHGSLLSGYVLLEEHTDWIAKASVGAIVVYWCGMTWIMNQVTGPLPY